MSVDHPELDPPSGPAPSGPALGGPALGDTASREQTSPESAPPGVPRLGGAGPAEPTGSTPHRSPVPIPPATKSQRASMPPPPPGRHAPTAGSGVPTTSGTVEVPRAQPNEPNALARPRAARTLDTDLAAILTAYATCVVGLWVRHGGLGAFRLGAIDAWASISRLSGLLASAMAVVGVVLAGRPRPIERMVGLDRILVWHRIVGDLTGILLAAHIAGGTVGWTVEAGWADTFGDLTGDEPYMALAVIGGAVVLVVALSSLRAFRRRLSYEAWYVVHLAAYVGIGLSYGHQIVLGTDLAEDRLARVFWAAIHLLALATVLWGRWGAAVRAWARPLTVVESFQQAPGVTTVTLGGPNLVQRSGAAGQFAFLRSRSRWWASHPFSLSAMPTQDTMRFTIKHRGRGSTSAAGLAVGARVAVEGPYGVTTREAIGDRRPIFIVGGVGVTPVRALMEDLPPGCQPLVLYRARSPRDLIHLAELQHHAARCGGRVLTLVGPTVTLADRDPFGAERLRSYVPNLERRVAVICGPERMVSAARAGLLAAGMPRDRIHYERVWW